MLGAKVGRGSEISTALLIPSLVTVGDHSFLADDTLAGPYELGGDWIRVERVKVGKRAFVGNSGMLAAGRKVPKQSLVAVLSAAPRRKSAKSGTSYLGSPPKTLRRAEEEHDAALTYDRRSTCWSSAAWSRRRAWCPIEYETIMDPTVSLAA